MLVAPLSLSAFVEKEESLEPWSQTKHGSDLLKDAGLAGSLAEVPAPCIPVFGGKSLGPATRGSLCKIFGKNPPSGP